ncbi:peptidylprolyl isomerase [Nonlabens antarcticus]|uniref:peptidylprolyl isomerase n=1 Tax=Nonlabens antarcticus TaxID=392714 RepID=UPI001891D263|nr:peptidylprolyl isomerase [Nonlabens antarcticus]
MKSKWICLLMLILITASCKDNAVENKEQEQKEEVAEPTKEEKTKQSLAEFYKPKMNRDGDTLLSYIPQDSVKAFFTRYGKKNPETKIRMSTKYGDIDMELFRETPIYRASFIYLIKNGYFDETVVYRTVPGFIVQAGDSDNIITAEKRGSAGDYKLEPHFLPNVKHAYGTLSSAKQWEDNPEDLHNPFDFFISLRATDHLDGEHTIFGQVISGMDVAEKISKEKTDSAEWPLVDVYIKMSVVE